MGRFQAGVAFLAWIGVEQSCGKGNCSTGTATTTVWIPGQDGTSSEWLPAFPNSPSLASSAGLGGDQEFATARSALGQIPVYARAGAMLPLLPQRLAIQLGSAARAFDALEWWVYRPRAGRGESAWAFEDDGFTQDSTSTPRGGEAARFVNLTSSYSVDPTSRCVNLTSDVTGHYFGAPTRRSVSFRLLQPPCGNKRQGNVFAEDGQVFPSRADCEVGRESEETASWCSGVVNATEGHVLLRVF